MRDFSREPSPDPFGNGNGFHIINEQQLAELGIDILGLLRAASQAIYSSNPYSYETNERQTYLATRALGEYVSQEGIKDIIFVDKSARPIRAGFSEYLELTNQPKPEMHFINPERFDVGNQPSLFSVTARAVRYINVRHELQQSNNTLLNHKHDPVLIFDACMHSGETAANIRDFLRSRSMGFTDVRIGAFTIGSNYGTQCKVDVDFAYTNNPNLLYCRPYGLDYELTKPTYSIYSLPHATRQGARQIADNRQSAKELVRQQHSLHNE